jgi:hypothetical protein
MAYWAILAEQNLEGLQQDSTPQDIIYTSLVGWQRCDDALLERRLVADCRVDAELKKEHAFSKRLSSGKLTGSGV